MNSLLLEAELYAIQDNWIVVNWRYCRSHFRLIIAFLIPKYLHSIAFEEFDCIGDELRCDLEFLSNCSGPHSGNMPLQQLRLLLKPLHIPLLDVCPLLSHSVTNPGISLIQPFLNLIQPVVGMELLFVIETYHCCLSVQVVCSQTSQTLHYPILGFRCEALVNIRISKFKFESTQGLQAQRFHLGVA